MASVSLGHATTITVGTTTDSFDIDSRCSLREAITAANTDTAVDTCPAGDWEDTIELPNGTYTLTLIGQGDDLNVSGDLDVTAKHELTIVGTGGQDRVIIDGGGHDRVLHVTTGAALRLEGVTITGGDTNGGGGGILTEGTLTLVDSTVTLNSASQGGGIRVSLEGSLVADHATINDNQTSGDGGGIFNASAYGLSVKLHWSTVAGNVSGSDGGGVWTRTIELASSTVADNTAAGAGGGIFWNHDSCHMNSAVNSTFSGNQSGTHGGAVLFDGVVGLFEMRNVTITGNTADFDGDDDGDGGGIYNAGSATLDLANTIVAGNADLSTGTFASYAPDCLGPVDSSGYNLFGAVGLGVCVIGGDTTGNQVGTIGAELDPLLGPLASYGGTTLTHRPTTSSPAVDAGDPAGCLDPDNQPLTVDQRGFDRIQDGPDADGDATCDVGAFELHSSALFVDGFASGGTGQWSDTTP